MQALISKPCHINASVFDFRTSKNALFSCLAHGGYSTRDKIKHNEVNFFGVFL